MAQDNDNMHALCLVAHLSEVLVTHAHQTSSLLLQKHHVSSRLSITRLQASTSLKKYTNATACQSRSHESMRPSSWCHVRTGVLYIWAYIEGIPVQLAFTKTSKVRLPPA